MTKVKICGITRTKDAIAACKQGAWAVGFIFYMKSPRYISPKNVFEIIKNLPKELEKIGVFVNSTVEEVVEIAKTAGLSMIQLHGDEPPEFCIKLLKKLNLPLIKAFRVKDYSDLDEIENYKDAVSFILLDTHSEKEFGGTGEAFNWEIAVKAKDLGIPLILAGGLNPDNIKKAITTVQPYALDVSSGVERDKGVKDPELIKKLFCNTGK